MKIQPSFLKSLRVVALVTALILAIPLVAMQFTTDVDWSIGDFIIMGSLIFGTGTAYIVATRLINNLVFRIAIACALGTTFLMIWSNLAVGLIGSGQNAGNLMYIGVLVTGIIGVILSKITSRGLERTMYAIAFALLVLTGIALSTGMQNYSGSSVSEIIGVNGFFALSYIVTGLLFRFVNVSKMERSINPKH